MALPKPSKPTPKPRPRTACDQRVGKTMCPETDTVIVPAFGDRDDVTGRERKQWRFCKQHREYHLADCIGGPRLLWAMREVIREELGG